jgi:S-adenosylmethionine decarboxylase
MEVHVLLARLEGCPAGRLDDARAYEVALKRAASAAGFVLVGLHVHGFKPQGRSAIAIVAESHIALHTWPEEDLGFAEVMSCSTPQTGRVALRALRDVFQPAHTSTLELAVGRSGGIGTIHRGET